MNVIHLIYNLAGLNRVNSRYYTAVVHTLLSWQLVCLMYCMVKNLPMGPVGPCSPRWPMPSSPLSPLDPLSPVEGTVTNTETARGHEGTCKGHVTFSSSCCKMSPVPHTMCPVGVRNDSYMKVRDVWPFLTKLEVQLHI